jgi:hypothetical protein
MENFREKFLENEQFSRKLSRKRKFSQLLVSFFSKKSEKKLPAKFSGNYENEHFRFNPTTNTQRAGICVANARHHVRSVPLIEIAGQQKN